MSNKIKILIVEHDTADLEFIENELRKGKINHTSEIVENEKDYTNALHLFKPDIILSDYTFPTFDGLTAFRIKESITPETPFIIISGKIGEEKASELIRNGVTDYVLKDKLFSLNSKIVRAYKESVEKKEKNQTFSDLQNALRDLEKIMSSSLDVICTINEEGRFTSLSAACITIFGYSPAELIGKKFMDLVYKDDVEITNRAALRIMEGIPATIFENRYVSKTGTIVYMLWSAKWDAADKLMYCVGKDATEKKNLEKAFETERLRFNDLFLKAPSSIGILRGPKHIFEMANPLYLQLIGKKDIIGKTVKEVLPETESQGFITLLDGVYKTGKTFVANEMLIKIDKKSNGKFTDIYLNFIYQAYKNASDEVQGIFFFAIDVTEQVLSRKKIEEDEKKYRMIVETAQEGIWMIDENNNTILVNKKLCALLEYSEQEMIGKNIDYFMDKHEKVLSVVRIEERKNKGSGNNDAKFITKSGKELWANMSGSPIHDIHGNYKGALAMITDITEKKRAEQEMTWLINNTEECFILLNTDLNIVSFNKQFEHLYDKYFGIQVTKGDSILDYAQPGRRDIVHSIYKKVLTGLEESSEVIVALPDSREKYFTLKFKPARDEQERIIGAFVSVIDITEKKAADQQLVLNEKRYRALIENGADAVVILTAEGKPLYISPTLERILGYTEAESMQQDMFMLFHPDDIPAIIDLWGELMAHPGIPLNCNPSRVLHKDGKYRWVEGVLTNMLHDPSVNGIVDNFRDITSKVEAQNLREFERRDKEALINSTSVDMIWSVSNDMTLIAANHAFIAGIQSFTGITLKSGDPLIMKDKYSSEYLDLWVKFYTRALTGESFKDEIYMPARKDVGETWRSVRFNPIYNGEVISGVACYSHDITASKNYEKALLDINRKLETAQQIAHLGYWELDVVNDLFTFNDQFYAIFKTTAAAVGGYTMTPERYATLFVHPDDVKVVEKSIAEAINSPTEAYNGRIEHRIMYATGDVGYVTVDFYIVKDSRNRTIKSFGVNQDITERKNAEEKIKENNRRFKYVTKATSDAIWDWDLVSETIYWGEGFQTNFGYNRKEIRKDISSWTDYIHPDDKERVLDKIFKFINGSEANWEDQYRFCKLDQAYAYVTDKGFIIRNDRGKAIRMVGAMQDITKQKNDEFALQQSEGRLQGIIGSQTNYVIRTDLQGNYSYYNQKFLDDYGWIYKKKNLIGINVMAAVMDYHHERIMETVQKCFSEVNKVFQVEIDKPKFGGGIRTTLWDFICLVDNNGQPTEIQCVGIDISERKIAEAEMNRLTERLLMATTSAKMGIWDFDIEKKDLSWDEGMFRLYNIDKLQFESVYEAWISRLHPDDKIRVNDEMQQAIEGKKEYDTEFRILWNDSSVHYIKATGTVERDAWGKPVRIIGLNWDITDDKEKEKHLQLLESVIMNATDAVMITEAEPFDEPGPRIVYVNPAFTRMTGYTAEEVIGKTPRIFQGPKSDKKELRRLGEAIRKWEPCEITTINYKKNGEEFWNNFTLSPMADATGWFTHWISFERDVSERMNSEIKLNQLNKNIQKHAKELAISNKELEQFAYVASHDLQEPLRMVTGFLTQLEKKYGDVIDDKGKKYISFAVDGARRMRQIILDLLEYSRVGRDEDNKEKLDLNEIINEIQILFSKQVEEKKAEFNIGTLPKIFAHRSPVRQLFQNLIGNALKYNRAEVAKINITSRKLKNHWQFSISDNGIGIDADYFDKIFIIFQRLHNKDEFSGTGMGLAVTKKIIENMGGEIWVESTEGKGSTFYFTILI